MTPAAHLLGVDLALAQLVDASGGPEHVLATVAAGLLVPRRTRGTGVAVLVLVAVTAAIGAWAAPAAGWRPPAPAGAGLVALLGVLLLAARRVPLALVVATVAAYGAHRGALAAAAPQDPLAVAVAAAAPLAAGVLLGLIGDERRRLAPPRPHRAESGDRALPRALRIMGGYLTIRCRGVPGVRARGLSGGERHRGGGGRASYRRNPLR